MKKLLYILMLAALSMSALFSAEAEKVSDKPARKAPDWLMKSIICQVPLRSFTQEGTLAAATERLGHLAEAGIGCVYLLPIVESDPDQNRAFWSPRQKKSNTNNPCNPYRIKNYFKIDSEYGTDADLKKFVERAHELGMKVMLDAVYYHCGPTADIITTNPDFVVRDENGNVKNGRWLFPELNFDNPKLREYLISNLEYFVREFGVDGYRADAEFYIPLDFWESARERLEKIKPDIALVAESSRRECQLKAYDANYCWGIFFRDYFAGLKNAKVKTSKELGKNITWTRSNYPKGARLLYHYDNHDISTDSGRSEAVMSYEAADAIDDITYEKYLNADDMIEAAGGSDTFESRVAGEKKTSVFVSASDKPVEISAKLSEKPNAYYSSGAKISGSGDSAKIYLEPYGFALVE